MDSRLVEHSVQDLRPKPYNNFLTLNVGLSGTTSLIEPWGRDWVKRDRQLADFWHTEAFLASAIASIVMTRASLTWTLEGPPRSVSVVRKMLMNSEFGAGWSEFISKICLDLLISDNGAFAEIIREPRSGVKPESAPVLGIAHLPSQRCIRTGDPMQPVLYVNEQGKHFYLKWYQVITFEELPATQPGANGRQICFVSRVLKAAEIIRDITTYQSEKVSGRFNRAVHIVGGVPQAEIDRMQERGNIDADNLGLARYMQPIIMAALDPNAKVSHVQIDLASLPDAFNFDEMMKWYISVIAMAAGGDFQDFAPLPGGNLGTASQSETLHRKSQRKGHALFMKMIENKLQQANVLPRNVTFRFNQQDAAAELEQAQISQLRVNTRATQLSSGEIDEKTARILAVEAGDLKHSHLILLNGESPSDVDNITLDEDEAEPPVDIEKELGLRIASVAANTLTKLIKNHPMNDFMSLDDNLLDVFAIELRNGMTHEARITTNTVWQSALITEAAKNAGIPPHLIRMRLPDNLVLVANNNGVFTNYAGYIYLQKEIAAPKAAPPNKYRIAHGKRCFKCQAAHVSYSYILKMGWVPVCAEHRNVGLQGRAETIQYDQAELLSAFRQQIEGVNNEKRKMGLFVSAMGYAQELKTGKVDLKGIKTALDAVGPVIGVIPSTILSQYLL